MADTSAAFRVHQVASPLRHRVTENIRDAIAAGHFKPGDHLAERELCDLIGVSRTLIREALRQLESEGIVEVRPHRGPFVTHISREQAIGIYRVREELESLACREFAARATDAQRAALKEALEEIKAAAKSEDSLVRLRAKNYFYQCLVDGAQNDALGTCIYMLNSRVSLLRATTLKSPGRINVSIKELSAVVDALLSNDAASAESLAREHVRNSARVAVALLDK